MSTDEEDRTRPRSEERLHQVLHLLAQAQLDLDQERLRHHETSALFDEILSAMSDAVVLVDMRGIVMRTNEATAALLGWTEEKALGRPIGDLLGPRVPASPWQLLMQHPSGVYAFETDVDSPGGPGRVSLSSSVVRDAAGKIVGAIYVARDLSETQRLLHQLEVAEARWRLLVEVSGLLSAALEPVAVLPEVARRVGASTGGRAWVVLAEDGWVRDVIGPEEQDPPGGLKAGEPLDPESAVGRCIDQQIPESGPVAAAPLLVQGRCVGALVLERAQARERSDVDLAAQVAVRVSLSLQNAALFDSERLARARAERAEQRMSFLAGASASLSALLNPRDILAEVARLAVPALGAACAIGFRRDEGHWVVAVTPPDARLADELRAVVEGRATPASLNAPTITLPLDVQGGRSGRLALARAADAPTFDDGDRALVEDFARRAATAVSNASLYHREHEVARVLQESLLPPNLPEPPAFTAAARYRPAREGLIGGDFYDVFEGHDGDWAVVIGDVCGKGVVAAAQTALARYTVRSALLHETLPSGALTVLNRAILSQSGGGQFCTVALAKVHSGRNGLEVTLSCGGHPLPVLVRADGTTSLVGPAGTLIGALDEIDVRDEVVLLHPGDLLVFYTDGVTEARVGVELFGEDNLLRTLQPLAGREPQEVVETVEAVAAEIGSIRDDLAVVAIRAR